MRRRFAAVFAFCLLLGGLSWSSAQAAPPPPPASGAGPLAVYTGTVDAATLAAIGKLGVDRQALKVAPVAGAEGQFTVEVILSGDQAEALAAEGATLTRARHSIRAAAAGRERLPACTADPAASRRSSSRRRLRTRDRAAAGDRQDRERPGHQRGPRHQGSRQDQGGHAAPPRSTSARSTRASGSHRRWSAGCWTTYLDGYGTDPRITAIVDTTELWFIPVANPDGYDFTFEGERLWRKNLRDNNGDGQITPGDGVDLNRNFPTRWGYDNEGSSPNPGSETYRGPVAGVRAGDAGARRAVPADHARVLRQLPLGRGAAAVRPRLAGGHAVARRRALRVDGRQRRHRLGDSRLRPRHLRGAVHHQRRHRFAHAGGIRHARLHARDVDVRDGLRRSTTTTRSSRRTARAASTSRTTNA